VDRARSRWSFPDESWRWVLLPEGRTAWYDGSLFGHHWQVLFRNDPHGDGIRKVFYDGKQRLSSIAEWPADNVIPAAATSIRVEYDRSDRIVILVDPLGMPTEYAYDGKGNLASVTAPYYHVRQYLYEDARFPNALTGVKDESGSRVATWTTDSSGRAISVTHPDTTRNVLLSYPVRRFRFQA
jgi:YD repeat-containing protein